MVSRSDLAPVRIGGPAFAEVGQPERFDALERIGAPDGGPGNQGVLAPVGASSTVTVDEDQSYVLTLADFGFDDGGDGDTFLQIEILGPPAGFGSITYDPDGAGGVAPSSLYEGQIISAAEIAAGAVVFTPDPNQSGAPYNAVTFYVYDSSGTRADDVNSITFDVDAINDAPTVEFPLPASPLPVGGEFMVNSSTVGGQGAPTIATLDDGSYVVVWLDDPLSGNDSIRGQRFESNGTKIGGEFQINTNGDPQMRAPVIAAVGGGGFVVAWENWQSATSAEMIVAAQRFDANGDAVGGEFTVNTTGGNVNSQPSIAAYGDLGGFVVVWHTFGTSFDVAAQLYDANGDPVGGEFRVNTYATSPQWNAEVAALQDGGFVVTWTSVGQDGTDGGVYAQRFDADGDPAGSEFRVNQSTLEDERDSHVTVLADGSFVITWASEGQYDSDIHARHFAADGTALGSRFIVRSSPNEENLSPRVTALADGGFVVTWHTDDSGDRQVYAQRYDSEADELGGRFSVNDLGIGEWPALAGLADGSFVIVWGGDQDGDRGSIQAQHFAGTFAATEQEALDLKGRIALSDTDDTGGSYTVTLSVVVGVLHLEEGTSGASVTDNDTGTVTITGTLVQIMALLDTDGTSVVTYTADTDTPPASISLTVTIDDGTDQDSASAPILITPVNDAPYLDLDFTDSTAGGFDSAAEWTVGDDPSALVYALELDDDNTGFAGAIVTAAFTANGGADDRLSIISVGDGLGELRVDGSDLYYEGTLVGTLTGGTDGSTPLTIIFNADACSCAVQLTLSSIAYSSASGAPDTSDRTVTIVFIDGGGTANGGADTALANVTVSVFAGGNEAPTVDIDAPMLPVGSQALVNSTTAGNQQVPRIGALDDGGYVAVWLSTTPDFSSTGVYAQFFNADGSARGSEFLIDLLGEAGPSELTVSGLEGGGFVVAWQESVPPFGYHILSQRFDMLGDPIEVATEVVPFEGGSSPVVTGLSGGGYVVTWVAYDDTTRHDVYAQIFDANNAPVGSPFMANASTNGSQTVQAVGKLSDGGFVITWTSFNNDSSFTEVFAQRFDASGNPVGPEMLVPTAPTGDQNSATVTGLANGGFVITWTNMPNYNDMDVRARLYDASGNPVGNEFEVNAPSPLRNGTSTVVALADGGFVITWQALDVSSVGDIYAQRYDASGVEVGDAYRVSEVTRERHSSVAVGLSGGGFAVAWISPGEDGYASGIFARTFAPAIEATEQVALDLKGRIAIADVDAASDFITVTLSVNEGVLNVDPGTSGVTVDDSDQQNIVLYGTLAEIQALLGSDPTSSVTYTYDDDYLPVATIELSVEIDDGTDVATDTVTIALTPVNDAAELDLDFTTPGNDAVATYLGGDPATPISYYATFDDDNTDWDGATLTIAIAGATADDQLSIDEMVMLDTSVVGNDIFYDGDLIGTFTGGTNGDALVITFNELACACAVEEIAYAIAYSNSGTVATLSTRDVTFTFVDGDGTANGGSDTATATVELTITPGPTPPVIDAGAAASGFEDAPIALSGVTITDHGDPVTGLLTVRLAVDLGTLTIRTDVAGGITAANLVNDASGRFLTIVATPAQINATLAATNGLTYRGPQDYFGTDQLTIHANDATPATPVAISELSTIPLGTYANDVSFYDLDGDQRDDLIFAFNPGTGDPGGFLVLAGSVYGIELDSGEPYGTVFGDYDGDNVTDLAFIGLDWDNYIGYVSSLTGDVVTIAQVDYAQLLVTADFDGDGRLDFAVNHMEATQIFLQTSPGVFAQQVELATSWTTMSMVTGDFDGDGAIDLLVSSYDGVGGAFTGTVELFAGNGDGSFAAGVVVGSVDTYLTDIVVADFNNDGVLDYATTSANFGLGGPPAGVLVAIGNGDGSFGPLTDYVTGPHHSSDLTAADINGDGLMDLVVINGTPTVARSFSVLVGNGDGSFRAPVEFDAVDQTNMLAIGDADGDGDQDLMVGNGSGVFTAWNNDTIARGSTAIKTINIAGVNDAPTGTDNTLTLGEDGTYVFTLADFGYSDVDGDAPSHIRIPSLPTAGNLWFDADGAGPGAALVMGQAFRVTPADLALGKLTYRPAANGNGTGYASFTFRVQDASGTANGGANADPTPNTITFNVTPVDDDAVAVSDFMTVMENATGTLAVLANDSDMDSTLQITQIAGQAVSPGGTVTLASGARVTLNANGTITYDPNGAFDWLIHPDTAAATGAANWQEREFFTYTLSDGVSATVEIEVRGLDSAGDQLRGTAAIDTIIGTNGNDIINGLGGLDSMRGGLGDDTYYVDTLNEKVQERVNQGTDSVFSSVNFTLGVNVENLTLIDAATNGTGNGLANILIGNGLANVLDGAEGDDSLFGGRGMDTLTGGTGADRFYFDTAPGVGNIDTISDFTVADDTIYLDRDVYAGILSNGTLSASAFVSGSAATTADHRIIYDPATGNLYYDVDGSGAEAAVQFAQLGTGLSLTSDDFVAFI